MSDCKCLARQLLVKQLVEEFKATKCIRVPHYADEKEFNEWFDASMEAHAIFHAVECVCYGTGCYLCDPVNYGRPCICPEGTDVDHCCC